MKQNRLLKIIFCVVMAFVSGIVSAAVLGEDVSKLADKGAFLDDELGEVSLTDTEGKAVTDETKLNRVKDLLQQGDLEGLQKELGTSRLKIAKNQVAALSRKFSNVTNANLSSVLKSDSEAWKSLRENGTEKALGSENTEISGGGDWDQIPENTTGLTTVYTTRDLAKRVASSSRGLVKNARKWIGELANDCRPESSGGKSNSALASKWSVEATNFPKNALQPLKKLGLDPAALQQELRTALAKGDRVAIEKACSKIARAKALASVGDIEGMIKNFEKSGALANVGARRVLGNVCRDIDSAFDDFDRLPAGQKDKLLEDVPTGGHDAAGNPIMTKGFDAFFAKNLDRAEVAMNSEVQGILDKCDGVAATIKNKADIGFVRDQWAKRVASLRSPKYFFSEKWENFKTGLKTTSRYDVAGGFLDAGETSVNILKKAPATLKAMFEGLLQSIIFMVPGVFQSAFMAQKQRQALLETLGTPITFGGFVLQIPDSCINLENPAATEPLYYGIPVSYLGQAITPAVQTQFGGSISGPTSNNMVSRAINTASSKIFSLGSLGSPIDRYSITAETIFIPLTNIWVTYAGPNGYVQTGSVPITSSQFSGQVVNLNTGFVTDGTGEVVNATTIAIDKSLPLVAMETWNTANPPQQQITPIKDMLPLIASRIELAHAKQTYVQYINGTGTSSGVSVSSVIQEQFDSSCISEAGSLTRATCGCMIVPSLEAVRAGFSMDASGQPSLSPEQALPVKEQVANILSIGEVQQEEGAPVADMSRAKDSYILGRLSATSSAHPASSAVPNFQPVWTGLGAVMPIFGWGSDLYDVIIGAANATGSGTINFPFYNPTTNTAAMVQKVGQVKQRTSVKNQPVEKEDVILGADSDTLWAAQGCWVYISAQTPFAQEIQKMSQLYHPALHASSIEYGPVGPYVDYIVFMDEDLNIIPAMVAQKVSIEYENAGAAQSYTQARMIANPAIKYWASLVSYNLPGFTANNQPIMYDLQGNIYNEETLAGQTGIITVFMTGNSQVNPPMPGVQGAFPEIFDQLETHIAALQSLYNSQPNLYANCSLLANPNYSITAPSGVINVYTGFHCFGSSVQDLWIMPATYPLGSSASFLALPDTAAKYAVSLITDIAYTLNSSNEWEPVDFSNSPFNLDAKNQPIKATKGGGYELQPAYENQLYFLSMFGSVIAPALQNYAQAQRKSWLENVGHVRQIGSMNVTLAEGIVRAQVSAQKSFIYQLTPAPVSLPVTDYFVFVDSANPSVTNIVPGSVTAIASMKSPVMISLVTGMLFDMTGSPLVDAQGRQRFVLFKSKKGESLSLALYQRMIVLFQKLPQKFVQLYQQSIHAYELSEQQIKGPYPFGSVSIAIRKSDEDAGNYVYVPAGGMHSKTFEPRDMYITVTESGQNYSLGDKLEASTSMIMSLVTGIVMNRQGVVVLVMNQDNLKQQVATMSSTWSGWLKTHYASLISSYRNRKQQADVDDAALKKSMQSFMDKNNKAISSLSPEQAVSIIKQLKPLPVPYSGILYDDQTDTYVYASPASSTDPNDMIYLFLDSGAVYRQNGSYLSTYSDAHLASVRAEHGVGIGSNDTMQLGVPMLQPALLLTEHDRTMKPGTNGETMLMCSPENYMGETFAFPNGYELYYSARMDSYYVYDAHLDRWVSVVGGHCYDEFGRALPTNNRVAHSTSGDLLLLYQTDAGLYQGLLDDGSDYANAGGSNKNPMRWFGQSSAKEIAVVANATFTTFTINQTVYTVDATMVWQSLFLVPVVDGALMKAIPGSSYQSAHVVMNAQGDITDMIWNDVMYHTASSSAHGSYTMAPVNTAVKGTIQVDSALIDPITDVPYLTITAQGETYTYGFITLPMTDAQMKEFDQTVVHGITVASPIDFGFGPFRHENKVITIAGKQFKHDVTIPTASSHNIFVQDIIIHSLTPVTSALVANAPSVQNAVTYAQLQLGLAHVLKTEDGRFVASINDSSDPISVSYVTQPAYVDLMNGVLFDKSTGEVIGGCLNLADFLKLLDSCQVSVALGSTAGTYQLTYRSSNFMVAQTAQLEENAAVAAA